MSTPDSPRRFVIRHVSGSKVNQVEEFPFDQVSEVTFGRSGSATVRFDPERDELVSREHSKITRDDDGRYTITDLGSRNGTFVNGVQVAGSASIRPGDTVQLGQDGPEFVFDAEPRPPSETRIASPRDAARPTMLAAPIPIEPTPTAIKQPVGRHTVERMVAEARDQDRAEREADRQRGGPSGAMIAAALGGIGLVALLAFFVLKPDGSSEVTPVTPDTTAVAAPVAAAMSTAEITREHSNAAVFIESSWRLLNADTDKPVLHQYQMVPLNGQSVPMAVYLRFPDGQIEPWITYSDPDGLNQPIRGAGTGSGFVISPDGFIMTNKHVVSTWDYPYGFPPGAFPGLMYTVGQDGQFAPQRDERGNVVTDRSGSPIPRTDILQEEQMGMWIPTQTRWVEQRPVENIRSLKGAPEIRVTFQNSNIPFEAELERTSPRADVATIKIDAQEPLHALELADTYETTAVGDEIVIMGFPGVSGFDVSTVENREVMGTQSQARVVPRVTVTPASVSSIIRSRKTDNPDERIVSLGFTDAYQLSTSATGHGNSGGPVFDDRGRVVGIFTYGTNTGDAAVTYAIPIRYGMELTRAQGNL